MCRSEKNGNVMAPPPKRIHNFVLSSDITAMCHSEKNGNVHPSAYIISFTRFSEESQFNLQCKNNYLS